MSEEKFDPIKEFTNLRDSLSKAVEQGVKGIVSTNTILVDVYETPDALMIRTAPIDGVKAESLEVSIENGILTISGETTPDDDLPTDAAALQRERRFGAFTRSVKLPHPVQGNQAQAKFRKGSLTITLPKIADSRPQVISITPAE